MQIFKVEGIWKKILLLLVHAGKILHVIFALTGPIFWQFMV
jgi:hypothetical protein